MLEADVCVIGAGPAGLALASHLACQGLHVVSVDPEPQWQPRYCLWQDEARALDVEPWLARTWTRTIVRTPGQLHELGRAYATLDNAAAAAGLRARGGHRLVNVRARCTDVTDAASGVVVSLGDGTAVHCRASVNAAGAVGQGSPGGKQLAPPTRSRRITGQALPGREYPGAAWPRPSTPPRPARAAQTAWGTIVDVTSAEHDLLSGDAAVLMAFDGGAGAPDGGPPSFVYALPLADGRVFLEETCLASTPPVDLVVLKERLQGRLGRALVEVERCFIPLDPMPTPGAIGAAAGLAHPCTGYSVATSWQLAPLLAEAIAGELAGPGSDRTARVTASIDAVLFSKRRRRTRALHRLGLDLLLMLDARTTASFFATVFASPPAVWRTFLEGDPAPDTLLAAMSSLFSSLERPVRRSLSRLVFTRHLKQVPALVPALARAVLGGAP